MEGIFILLSFGTFITMSADYFYYIGQTLGIIAFFIGIIVFIQKTDRKLKVRLAIYTAVMATHFFFLGAPSAGISAALNATRTVVSIYYRRLSVMYIFITLTLVLAVPNITHAMEVLPIIGTLFSTIAFFTLTGFKMRYAMWCSTFCWVIYNFWLGTIGGALIEFTFLVLNGYTIFRFKKLAKQNIDPFKE